MLSIYIRLSIPGVCQGKFGSKRRNIMEFKTITKSEIAAGYLNKELVEYEDAVRGESAVQAPSLADVLSHLRAGEIS
jgi:hypothetical protein